MVSQMKKKYRRASSDVGVIWRNIREFRALPQSRANIQLTRTEVLEAWAYVLEKGRIPAVAATFVRRQNKCEMIDPQLPSRSIMIMTARAGRDGVGRQK